MACAENFKPALKQEENCQSNVVKNKNNFEKVCGCQAVEEIDACNTEDAPNNGTNCGEGLDPLWNLNLYLLLPLIWR